MGIHHILSAMGYYTPCENPGVRVDVVTVRLKIECRLDRTDALVNITREIANITQKNCESSYSIAPQLDTDPKPQRNS